jgi:cytochrome oxidase Cu insertion factor (SCO1/SenC/PrrC family)
VAVEAAALAVVVAGVALVALTLATPSSPASAAGTSSSSSGSLRWPIHGAPAPPLNLPDQNGQRTTIADLRGHVVLLTFLDSRCTNLCPIEGAQLAQVQHHLTAGEQPELVVVSVNPADTRASVARFVRQAGWTRPWRWLLGTKKTLAPVWREYHIGVRFSKGRAVQTGNTTIHVAGTVSHTIALYLIDSHGREQFGYLPPFQPAAVAREVAALERPS